MHASASRLGYHTRDAVLALVAFVASAAPFVRELSDAHRYVFCGPARHAIAPVGLVEEAYAVGAKLAVTIAILALAAFVTRFATGSPFSLTLASLPLVRSALVIGALTATGLTAFDLCTAFHGASTDVAGSCHCWLTGVLAAAGGLFTIGTASIARAIHDVLHDLRSAFASFVVWLERECTCAGLRHRIVLDQLLVVELLRVTRVGGRAPPFA